MDTGLMISLVVLFWVIKIFRRKRAQMIVNNERIQALKNLWIEQGINHPLARPGVRVAVKAGEFDFSARLETTAAKNGSSICQLKFEAFMKPGLELLAQTESECEDWAYKMSLPRRYQTGDPLFDQKFFVAGDDQNILKKIFGRRKIRALFLSLNALGVKTVKITGGKALILLSPYEVPLGLEDDLFFKVLPKLADLLTKLNLLIPSASLAKSHPDFVGARFLNGITVTISSLGAIIWFFAGISFETLDEDDLVVSSLWYSVSFALAYLGLVAALAKGTPYVRRVLIVAVFFGSLGWGQLAWGSSILVNILFDESQPSNFLVTILGKSRSARNRYCELTFNLSPNGRDSYRIKISRHEYDQISVDKSRIRVFVRQGALGFKWLERYEILP